MSDHNNIVRWPTHEGKIQSFPIEGKYPHEAWALVRQMVGERRTEPDLSHLPFEDRVTLVRRVLSLLHRWVGKRHEDAALRIQKQDYADRLGFDSVEEYEAALFKTTANQYVGWRR
jgi:hypothetical protein